MIYLSHSIREVLLLHKLLKIRKIFEARQKKIEKKISQKKFDRKIFFFESRE